VGHIEKKDTQAAIQAMEEHVAAVEKRIQLVRNSGTSLGHMLGMA
jgi:DNA-binding GntR family transcriptional regulator